MATAARVVPPTQDGAKLVPPTQDGAKEVPPTQDGARVVPPTQDGAKEVPPTQDGARVVPPTQDGAKVVPPTQDGAIVVPPTQDGAKVVPPTQDGARVVPPTQDGAKVVPPTQDGAIVVPPTQDGAIVVPPTQDGAIVVPPAQGGAKVVPPTQDGARVVPPVQDVSQAATNYVIIFNVTAAVDGTSNCVPLWPHPHPVICVYPEMEDRWVSHDIIHHGAWESHIVRSFLKVLNANGNVSDMGVFDFGANIGQYSIIAAALGHNVVAVEPHPDNLRLFHESIKLGHFEDRITVLKNVISDNHDVVILDGFANNKGAFRVRQLSKPCVDQECLTLVTSIHMEDILELGTGIPFRNAIMKVDIEGLEPRAFRFVDKLFNLIHIPYIYMEWLWHGIADESSLVDELVGRLLDMGYLPYSIDLEQLLSPDWRQWPIDVVWKLSHA